MKEGDTILIMPSFALNKMRMEQLVGTRAIITNVVANHDIIRGCWVKLPRPFLSEEEWYIPYISIG